GFFAMFEAVSDAVANGLGDQAAQFGAQSPAHGVATQGEREAGELLPPDAQVDDAMQPKLRKEELSFMNEQTRFDNIVLHGFDDFVEGQNDRFKIGLKEFEGEISGSFQTGHANAQALEIVCLQSFCGDNDGTVTFAEAGASVEKD